MNLMNNAVINTPRPVNEPVLAYAPGSPEKLALKAALAETAALLVLQKKAQALWGESEDD